MESEKSQLILRSRKAFTRLARFVNQLMREQLANSPVTVQQCYTLEALADGPKAMNELASEVALHQSTLSRIVEKLEKQGYVNRARLSGNQRKVEVQLTDEGKKTYQYLDIQCNQVIAGLIDLVPESKQKILLESIEEITRLLDHQNSAFRQLLSSCCSNQTNQGTQIMDKK
ncbi:MAG: MarR family transcriptional regulator [Proteobacteria bacterium]|nr:MarR family transcriptional regulator [Pseudomonadota bacterium]